DRSSCKSFAQLCVQRMLGIQVEGPDETCHACMVCSDAYPRQRDHEQTERSVPRKRWAQSIGAIPEAKPYFHNLPFN
ncbi:MAG: hypothetical protein L0287_31525, partial [Anaerolineae bacterium]|nr:hypothetical protein [Anaerolineae bacterium]